MVLHIISVVHIQFLAQPQYASLFPFSDTVKHNERDFIINVCYKDLIKDLNKIPKMCLNKQSIWIFIIHLWICGCELFFMKIQSYWNNIKIYKFTGLLT